MGILREVSAQLHDRGLSRETVNSGDNANFLVNLLTRYYAARCQLDFHLTWTEVVMQRWMCVFICSTVVFLSASADGNANTLTKKEAAEGWLSLFDGETTFGWDVDGEVSVKNGMLIAGGKKATTLTFRTPFALFDLHFEGLPNHVWMPNVNKLKPSVFVVNTKDPRNPIPTVGVYCPRETKKPVWGKFHVTISNRKGQNLLNHGGNWEWANMGIGTEGSPTKMKTEAAYQIRIHVPKGEIIQLKAIKLKPLGTKSLFNGKNLEGWKVLPGHKSKYTVTKEGWMNVKDGRGDIQTIDTFKNFILQLECISNGEHLNSGIFFRCLPNQYQQGYEAQIRNQFTPGEERVYKLKKYDPKTHKDLGTFEVKSTAFDYGTGAIYRRMPARKGVAKDREWFTLTVAAHDNHLATWVNGVQVVDWTDHRPLNDNARQGCCLNPGVISIQGHDPTTDLSFRNFRIAEFPEKK